jgi:carboxyl-terminal processing protease
MIRLTLRWKIPMNSVLIAFGPATLATKRHRLSRVGIASLILPLGILGGCGSGGGAGTVSAEAASASASATNAEVVALANYMADEYFWYKDIPKADLSKATTAEEALELLKFKPKDRYSYIDTLSNFNAFFQEGKSVGAGFGMADLNSQVRIEYVRPSSPAQAAGLRRGDRIVKANGVTAAATANTTAVASINTAIGPREIGNVLVLDIERAGSPLQLTITKDSYDIITVSDSKVIDQNGRKIGYLYFYSFIARTIADWNSAIANLKAQGAQDLIVDMRNNGGGYLDTASKLSSNLRKTAPMAGEYLTAVRYNDKLAGRNYKLPFGADSGIRFDKVAFLMTDGTCSASELLINGLVPYQTVVTVGSNTCGKPVGFSPREYNSAKVFSIAHFDLSNSVGDANYYDGLIPTCKVDDDYNKAFGDPTELLLETALKYLSTGACATAASEPNAKSVGQTVRAKRIAPINQGVAGTFGLY